MRFARQVCVFPLCLVMAVSTAAFAGPQHVVDPHQLASAVATHAAGQDADRAAIHDALARPEVRAMAARFGLDLARADAAADTLSGADLARAGEAARQVNKQLVGGASTVTLSTTTVIIALLIVILLVVAIK